VVARPCPLFAFLTSVAVGTVGMGSAAATNAGIVSYNFNTGTISNPPWTFLNPAGTATDSDNGTDAVIAIPSGASQYASTTEAAPALVQTVSNGDFSAQVEFASEVTQADQEQGLIAIQDSSDFIRFDIESIGTQAYVSAQATIGGVVTTESQLAVRNGANFYLRVARSGNTWSYSYSYNGQAWTSEGSFALTLTLAQVGPYAASGPAGSASAPGFTALVSYFDNIAGTVIRPPDHHVVVRQQRDLRPGGRAPGVRQRARQRERPGGHGVACLHPQRRGLLCARDGRERLPAELARRLQRRDPLRQPQRRRQHGGHHGHRPGRQHLHPDRDGQRRLHLPVLARQLQRQLVERAQHQLGRPGRRRGLGHLGEHRPHAPDRLRPPDRHRGHEQLEPVPGHGPRHHQRPAPGRRQLSAWGRSSAGRATPTPATASNRPTGTPSTPGSTMPTNGPPNQDGDDLNIYANSPNHHEQVLASDTSGMQLTVGTTYNFEMQATTNAGGTTSQYSFKVWQAGTTEPPNWLVQANGDLNQGSLLLASYWAGVSYGPVTVTSLAPAPTPPVPAGTVLGAWKVVQSSYTTASSPTTSQTVTATLPAGTTAGDDVVVVLAGATSGAAPTLTPGNGLVALAGYPGPTQPASTTPSPRSSWPTT
jgi:regulation of enolase protein 1 (concanavalin A-like superfamily)